MDLPKDFLVKMKDLLQDEYDAFIKSYDEHKISGLRVNTLKISIDEFLNKSPFSLEPVPWAREGFYYGEGERPGKHPYHEAGLYYIQEPSAMAVVELLDPQPGEKILDLAAAPGGKTTHIASRLKQQGLLVSNEIHPARAKILSQNVERMGIKNAVVTNETPNRLAEKFPGFFDGIIVDAPCSGEGMFRKDPEARAEWSLENVALCAVRQMDILPQAARMLKPGGRLVYSTCTFSPEENEGVISQFIKLYPSFEIEEVQVYEGFGQGRKDWGLEGVNHMEKTVRIWPHQTRGEGHYIAVLRKKDGEEAIPVKTTKNLANPKLLKDFFQFAEEFLFTTPKGEYILFGEQLYLIPQEMIGLENLKVLRPGWHLGTLKKNRFEPSHALALSLEGKEAKYTFNLSKDSPKIVSFLKGETLRIEGPKGWYLVMVDGYSIGWGKLTDQVLKNHYPKALRWN